MFIITAVTVGRAIKRSFARKCFVRYAGGGEIDARCDKGHTHTVRYWRNPAGDLFGECFDRETGELCPSEMGRHLCYHISSTAWLFLAIEAMRRRAAKPAGIVKGAVSNTRPLSVGEGGREADRAPEPQRAAPLRVSYRVTRRDGVERVNGVMI